MSSTKKASPNTKKVSPTAKKVSPNTPNTAKKAATTFTAEEKVGSTYGMVTQREHILLRPDTYTGAAVLKSMKQYVAKMATDSSGKIDIHIAEKTVEVVPTLLKIVSELLDNARDRTVAHLENRGTEVVHITDEIRVEMTETSFSIMNNGDGVPIVSHPEHKIYVPEMIFAHLLTGSNFNDDVVRFSGGRNGFGAKLANIWSIDFRIETADGKHMYVQECSANMTIISPPVITKYTKKPFTRITIHPDFERMNLTGFTQDHVDVIFRRIIDIAGTPAAASADKAAGEKAAKEAESVFQRLSDSDQLLPGTRRIVLSQHPTPCLHRARPAMEDCLYVRPQLRIRCR
jgi:DNA gyrase/topoisomerase IV subunit B